MDKNNTTDDYSRKSSMQKSIYILLPFLVYVLVHDIAQLFLQYIFTGAVSKGGELYSWYLTHTETVNAVIWAMALAVAAASVIPFIRKDEILPADYKLHGVFNKLRRPEQWCILLILACSLSLGLNILLQLVGITSQSEGYDQTALRQYGIAFGLGVAIYGILSPVVEEIIFRGVVYNRMKKYFPLKLSMVVISLLFGLYHQNIVQGIYGFIMGLLLVYSYELFDSFTAPVLVHVTANCLIYALGYYRIIDRICTVPVCIITLLIAFMSIYTLRRTTGISGKN